MKIHALPTGTVHVKLSFLFSSKGARTRRASFAGLPQLR